MILEKLKPLEQESRERRIPIIGSGKGEWLLRQVQLVKPIHVLELGTANGYSGIILGSEGAELTTIEQNTKIADEAKKNFSMFGINAKVIVGDAVEIVQEMVKENQGKFDIIFIDFSKKKYIAVLESCLKMVRVGGYIIADNITMEGCQNYKKAVEKHPALNTEIIELKDRLALSQRVY